MSKFNFSATPVVASVNKSVVPTTFNDGSYCAHHVNDEGEIRLGVMFTQNTQTSRLGASGIKHSQWGTLEKWYQMHMSGVLTYKGKNLILGTEEKDGVEILVINKDFAFPTTARIRTIKTLVPQYAAQAPATDSAGNFKSTPQGEQYYESTEISLTGEPDVDETVQAVGQASTIGVPVATQQPHNFNVFAE